MPATWEATLAGLQQDLDAIERALATGSQVVALPRTAPLDLGPVPPPLRPRAEELLARIARTNAQLRRPGPEAVRPRRHVGRRRDAAYHGVARGA